MRVEMEALQRNGTWNVVSLPQGKRPVGSKWVFTIKHKADGSIDRYKFDVKNDFLHGDLEEEVYMDLPPGYETPNEAEKVCRLQKALYGLKQSPMAWFGRFTEAMKKYGYRPRNADHTLLIKCMEGKVALLIIYVDDMVVIGDDTEEIKRLQGYLLSNFEMKDLGGLKYFLGIEVARSYDDIAYAVSVVSQFMHAPSEDHMAAVMRILSYLKGAPGRGLIFRKHGHMEVKRYTDADWVGNITDRCSTSGYFTFVAGNLVTWRSKKQNVVARSTAEAEYKWMAYRICELLWLRILLTEIGFRP
ncbi:unnamed protein product [Malus baccata var. baccata]